MKIKFSGEEIEKAPKEYTRIEITEKDFCRLKIEGGKEILEIGTSKKWTEIDQRKFLLLCRTIIQTARQNKSKNIAIELSKFIFPKLKDISALELSSIIAQNFEMANFEFNFYKKIPKDGWNFVEEILIYGSISAEMKKGFEKGKTIGEEINKCRALSNTPGGDMTPSHLALKAKEALKGLDVSIKVFDEKEMKKIGMGAVLGVAKGSPQKPRFIILEYKGGLKDSAPIVLVGKGVTFDTGGLSLKPADSMLEMHMDMSGGAAVIHAIALAARLKIKKNVIVLVPAVENMPGGESYRPGDILKSLSGKTIEILNTDAEGRVILADALTYAERYKPRLVVDVATLTGASLVALGQQASAIMTKDLKIQKFIEDMGEESGDYVWPFPLWDEYEKNVKGNFADLANIPAKGNSRYAGVINGGMFLYQFAKNYPWVHIDMAPVMTSSDGEYLGKGATGAPIRLLLKILEKF